MPQLAGSRSNSPPGCGRNCKAIVWVASELKATLLEPRDFDVRGLADGMSVRFEVRAGRLGGWTKWACTESAARAGGGGHARGLAAVRPT